ncbi:hypothetical protein BV22DRAFT_463586 [Leucogyrophana mollusca]|uniref:Uncharacterized protein n=1 Tax=Leucogyrophana mollusca TaxID=85980 RepID=A0ACB8BHJ1_9AGAM|nr:hypothetical protein BV22DRAFT_463586 [Leucogyrophana mollusca]
MSPRFRLYRPPAAPTLTHRQFSPLVNHPHPSQFNSDPSAIDLAGRTNQDKTYVLITRFPEWHQLVMAHRCDNGTELELRMAWVCNYSLLLLLYYWRPLIVQSFVVARVGFAAGYVGLWRMNEWLGWTGIDDLGIPPALHPASPLSSANAARAFSFTSPHPLRPSPGYILVAGGRQPSRRNLGGLPFGYWMALSCHGC